jgi:S-adenosylmethionine uptake transporter
MHPVPSFSENTRGILLMLGASAGFILNDTCVKLASEELTVAEIVVVRSVIALPVVGVIGLLQGAFDDLGLLAERFIWLRAVGEIGAAMLYLSALARMDITNATAIIQLIPLAVTATAALLLREKVGLRRWSAIAIGFAAVLIIIRPGLEEFNVWSLSAMAAVGFIVLRDLSSRLLPAATHPLAVTCLSLAAMIPVGLAMVPFSGWAPLTAKGVMLCAASGLLLSAAYVMITQAMRHGEIGVVSPFRYSILLMAIVIQIAVFSTWPDAPTLVGSAILVGTGLYTLYRERRVKAATILAARKPAAYPP